jgi:hypothetical protein
MYKTFQRIISDFTTIAPLDAPPNPEETPDEPVETSENDFYNELPIDYYLKRDDNDSPDSDNIYSYKFNNKYHYREFVYLQDELNRLKDNDKIISEYFEKWDDDDVEYPLLQNLERVQGSERDIIIISTVYGRDEKRDMYQRFPLINTKFGHRRLNVLFTRAKNRLILVTSLRPSDIHVNSGVQNRGKTILKEYIEYASFSPVSQPYQEIKEADSDFEVSVMTALKDYGFDLTPQVGVKGFRIDIGVKQISIFFFH